MEKLLDKIFDFDKISTKFVLLLLIVSSFLLFVPIEFLSKLNLTKFNEEYGKYIGITFLFSFSFLSVALVTAIINWVRSKKFKIKREKEIIEVLNNLDDHEKAILREFLLTGSSTLQLPFDDPAVNGLHGKGIIYQVANIGFTYLHGSYFNYSIVKFAVKELVRNAHLVGLPTMAEGISNERRNYILNNRPNWAKTKQQFDS